MSSEPTLAMGILFSDGFIREEGTGKNTFIGSFQGFMVEKFPKPVARFYVTALLMNLAPDVRQVQVTAKLENPRSREALCASAAKIVFKSPPDPEEATEVVLPMIGVVFPEQGLYNIVILVDNKVVGQRNVFAQQIESKKSPS